MSLKSMLSTIMAFAILSMLPAGAAAQVQAIPPLLRGCII